MALDQGLLKYFTPDEKSFIETLYANGQLLITHNKNALLPSGVTHILLLKDGERPQLLRIRFA